MAISSSFNLVRLSVIRSESPISSAISESSNIDCQVSTNSKFSFKSLLCAPSCEANF